MGWLVVLCVVVGCSAPRRPDLLPRHRERDVAHLGGDPQLLVSPVAYTDSMQRLAREVAGRVRTLEKLRRLQRHLFDAGSFPFDYDSRKTLTAIEAFEQRTGNCVSFTNLFIALARSIGVPVRAALQTTGVQAEREGDLIVVNEHMVAVYEHSGGATVFDFNLRSERERVGLRLVDDAWIAAVYLNNLGAEALLAGDAARARSFLETAVVLAPRFAPAFGNLGVVRRQLGDEAGALAAYRSALEIDAGYPTILGNLAALYLAQGREAEARSALQAAKLRGASPYHLLIRGDFALGERRWGRALRLYRQAARFGRDLPEPWVAIARLRIARGAPTQARRALRRALELDPGHAFARELLRRLGSEGTDGDREGGDGPSATPGARSGAQRGSAAGAAPSGVAASPRSRARASSASSGDAPGSRRTR